MDLWGLQQLQQELQLTDTVILRFSWLVEIYVTIMLKVVVVKGAWRRGAVKSRRD